jgi:hypothetical protein
VEVTIASRLLVRRFLPMATLDLSIIPLVKAGDRHGLHLLLSTCAESVLDDRDHVALPQMPSLILLLFRMAEPHLSTLVSRGNMIS